MLLFLIMLVINVMRKSNGDMSQKEKSENSRGVGPFLVVVSDGRLERWLGSEVTILHTHKPFKVHSVSQCTCMWCVLIKKNVHLGPSCDHLGPSCDQNDTYNTSCVPKQAPNQPEIQSPDLGRLLWLKVNATCKRH